MSTTLKDKYGLTEAEANLAAHRIRLGGEEEPVVGKILSDRVGQAAEPAAPSTAPANYVENAAELAAVARRKAEDQAARAEDITAKAEELTQVPSTAEVGTPEPDPTAEAREAALKARAEAQEDSTPAGGTPPESSSGEPAGEGGSSSLPPSGFDPAEHTVEEVQRHVVDYPDEVQAVYEAERDGKNRSTLVAWLAENGADEPEAGG